MHRFEGFNIAGFSMVRLVFLTGLAVPCLSQEQHGFDVASIKPTAGSDGRALLQATPGRLAMTNLALRRLILIAWDVQDYQLVGEPGWIGELLKLGKEEPEPNVVQLRLRGVAARIASAAGARHAIEPVENVRHVFGGDAAAGIRHHDLYKLR